ncbi:hypothetical protein BV22DRAFT_1135036 [Leucogyrophana mollusca]|uniref:Uncharacterized protein n=1 Tax=Leucogyrophana mollusca TaxID=85980 RepID=A0ACB8AWH7_9AGAM|nr:hypothetical protein BV22DRAFT_1135036 [Leucogyrophana mollusca]
MSDRTSKPRSYGSRDKAGGSSKRTRVNSTKSSCEAAEDLQGARQKKKARRSDTAVRSAEDAPAIPVSTAPREAENPSPWDLLMQLDSWQRPGLPVNQFRKLFKSCNCGLVMTERVFETHECARILHPDEVNTVVDLTAEETE